MDANYSAKVKLGVFNFHKWLAHLKSLGKGTLLSFTANERIRGIFFMGVVQKSPSLMHTMLACERLACEDPHLFKVALTTNSTNEPDITTSHSVFKDCILENLGANQVKVTVYKRKLDIQTRQPTWDVQGNKFSFSIALDRKWKGPTKPREDETKRTFPFGIAPKAKAKRRKINKEGSGKKKPSESLRQPDSESCSSKSSPNSTSSKSKSSSSSSRSSSKSSSSSSSSGSVVLSSAAKEEAAKVAHMQPDPTKQPVEGTAQPARSRSIFTRHIGIFNVERTPNHPRKSRCKFCEAIIQADAIRFAYSESTTLPPRFIHAGCVRKIPDELRHSSLLYLRQRALNPVRIGIVVDTALEDAVHRAGDVLDVNYGGSSGSAGR